MPFSFEHWSCSWKPFAEMWFLRHTVVSEYVFLLGQFGQVFKHFHDGTQESTGWNYAKITHITQSLEPGPTPTTYWVVMSTCVNLTNIYIYIQISQIHTNPSAAEARKVMISRFLGDHIDLWSCQGQGHPTPRQATPHPAPAASRKQVLSWMTQLEKMPIFQRSKIRSMATANKSAHKSEADFHHAKRAAAFEGSKRTAGRNWRGPWSTAAWHADLCAIAENSHPLRSNDVRSIPKWATEKWTVLPNGLDCPDTDPFSPISTFLLSRKWWDNATKMCLFSN